MKTVAISLGAVLLAGCCAAPAWAHHSGAMFDFKNCQVLTGTVRTLEWNYPHNWLWIEVPQSNGAAAIWGFEFMSPTQAKAIDPLWSKNIIAKGDKVTVKFGPLRDGRNGGALSWVKIPSGHVLGASPGICGAPP